MDEWRCPSTRTGISSGNALDNTSAEGSLTVNSGLPSLIQLSTLSSSSCARGSLHLSLDVARARHVILVGVRRRENNSCPKYCQLFCAVPPQGLGHRPQRTSVTASSWIANGHEELWLEWTCESNGLLSCRLRTAAIAWCCGGLQRDQLPFPPNPSRERRLSQDWNPRIRSGRPA